MMEFPHGTKLAHDVWQPVQSNAAERFHIFGILGVLLRDGVVEVAHYPVIVITQQLKQEIMLGYMALNGVRKHGGMPRTCGGRCD